MNVFHLDQFIMGMLISQGLDKILSVARPGLIKGQQNSTLRFEDGFDNLSRPVTID